MPINLNCISIKMIFIFLLNEMLPKSRCMACASFETKTDSSQFFVQFEESSTVKKLRPQTAETNLKKRSMDSFLLFLRRHYSVVEICNLFAWDTAFKFHGIHSRSQREWSHLNIPFKNMSKTAIMMHSFSLCAWDIFWGTNYEFVTMQRKFFILSLWISNWSAVFFLCPFKWIYGSIFFCTTCNITFACEYAIQYW